MLLISNNQWISDKRHLMKQFTLQTTIILILVWNPEGDFWQNVRVSVFHTRKVDELGKGMAGIKKKRLEIH